MQYKLTTKRFEGEFTNRSTIRPFCHCASSVARGTWILDRFRKQNKGKIGREGGKEERRETQIAHISTWQVSCSIPWKRVWAQGDKGERDYEAGIPTRSNWHTKPASPPGSSKQPFGVPFRTENSRRQKLPLGIPAGAGAAGVLDSGETYAALWECEFRG